MSFWVTIITMARLPVTIRSVVNMLAVILISVLVHHTPNVTVTLSSPISFLAVHLYCPP